jgi:Nucleotidyl transferase AbiEii toxin, Type IV TA system
LTRLETAKEKYKTAKAFRVAIAGRLKKLSRETGEPYIDLYRRVAIDRFLARLDWSKWTAKGGYILQRRLPKARPTKDIDLSTADPSFILSDSEAQQTALAEAFQEMTNVDVGDYFEFQVAIEKPLLGFGKGGIRCIVRSLIDGQTWSAFQLDAIIQEKTVFPSEALTGDTFFSFAGIEPLTLRVPIKEEVFAEKIHAYTLPRENENSRVKDMLDLALLIEDGLDTEKTKTAVAGVFAIRKTHSAPPALPPPPASWQDTFNRSGKRRQHRIDY